MKNLATISTGLDDIAETYYIAESLGSTVDIFREDPSRYLKTYATVTLLVSDTYACTMEDANQTHYEIVRDWLIDNGYVYRDFAGLIPTKKLLG